MATNSFSLTVLITSIAYHYRLLFISQLDSVCFTDGFLLFHNCDMKREFVQMYNISRENHSVRQVIFISGGLLGLSSDTFEG